MFLIETDILLAVISAKDRHHSEVLELVDRLDGKLLLSPYSLLELDLIIKSGKILVSDVYALYQAISAFLEYRRIGVVPPKPIHHAEAYRLRQRHRELTYFDSLHAAVSITERLKHVSYDNIYEKIGEADYVHPSKIP